MVPRCDARLVVFVRALTLRVSCDTGLNVRCLFFIQESVLSQLGRIFNFLLPHAVFFFTLGGVEAVYASLDGGLAAGLMALAAHAVVGVVLSPVAVLVGVARLKLRITVPKHSKWVALAIAGLATVVATVSMAWLVWHKGIILSAIDPRPIVAVGAALVGGLGTGWLAWRYRTAVAGIIAMIALVGAAMLGVSRSATHEGVESLAEGRSTSGALARFLRAGADADQDGYPAQWCAETCDCDDGNADISPVAVEIPGNGIDDDCADGDLELAPASELEAPAEPAGDAPDKPRVRNVLLITIDTLRADRLGCYGYQRDTSPRLDALAASGVRFHQARAQGPMTRFSVPSLMTSRYFSELERSGGDRPRVFDSALLISEIYKSHGYHTAAFHSIGYLLPLFGLSQGFDVYDVSVVRERAPVHWNPTGDLLTDRILAHADEKIAVLPDDQPWFLWTYYGDPHSSYIQHDGLPDFGKSRGDVYDQEILFTDIHLGRMLDGLRERGMLDDTVIVVTSDHGEGLDLELDHGFHYHGQTLFDNLLRVPLIVVVPGLEPRVVERPVGNIDVVPTLLELTGHGKPEGATFHGRSLLGLMQGTTSAHPPTFSEKATTRSIPQKSMVDWPYKIIWHIGPNRFQLYDVSKDPGELTNLAKAEPEVLQRLKEKIQRWRSTQIQERRAVRSRGQKP